VVGLVAHRGRGSIGYYKDEAKTAATVKMIDGERWTVVGDFATVEADGSLRLLGRGSQCINTGGEKVFAEEVEEVLKAHPDVVDCACVGVPHDVFGEAVAALVELRPGAALDEPALIAHVKARLAGYKAPKRVHAVTSLQRGPNGKLDYRILRERALELD
jgi:acyl-CoA synthetase (AMP-forming)/AMP-acid ligase II